MKKWEKAPIVSVALVAVNLIVYLLCMFGVGNLYSKGCLGLAEVFTGKEYGRIIWAMFLHGNAQHLFNNMIILLFLGAMLEKEIGHWRYLFLYFISGIGGNLFSLIEKYRSGSQALSLGASGVAFGLDGVLLALFLFGMMKLSNVTLPRVLFVILFSLYSGFSAQNVDNAAHVGGLLTGFAFASAMCVLRRGKQRRQ